LNALPDNNKVAFATGLQSRASLNDNIISSPSFEKTLICEISRESQHPANIHWGVKIKKDKKVRKISLFIITPFSI